MGLQWSVESMINILACLVFPYGHAEFMYFDSKNLPRFGMKFFENLILSSNTSNMYIKWKLKSYWIQIWQKKSFFLKKFRKTEKKNFFLDREFLKKKFQMRTCQKTFFTTLIFFSSKILNTKKRIYIEFWHFLVCQTENSKLPNSACLDSTPPYPSPVSVKIHQRALAEPSKRL